MKSFKIIITSLAAAVIAFAGSASAATATSKEVTKCEFSRSGSSATVSGSAETGMLAVAIEVLNEDDESVVLETASVAEDGAYSYTFSNLSSTAALLFRVADYNGGDWCIAEAVSEEETPAEEEAATDDSKSSPGTGAMPAETSSAESTHAIALAIAGVAVVVLGITLAVKRFAKKY